MSGSWSNIEKDGRRLEKIEKFCEKMIFKGWKYDKEADSYSPKEDETPLEHSIVFGYMDRLTKASAQKTSILDRYLGVKKLLGENKEPISAR